MALNSKTHVDVERVISETPDPVRVGGFLLRRLLSSERAIYEPARLPEQEMRQVIRSWGAASYAGLSVSAASQPDMVSLNLAGRPCNYTPSIAVSGFSSVIVPVDLFVLAAQIVDIRDGVSDCDESGLIMALDRGLTALAWRNAPREAAMAIKPLPRLAYGWAVDQIVQSVNPTFEAASVSGGLGIDLGMRVPGGMA